MSNPPALRHQMAAIEHYNNGRYRQAADEYWRGFQACPSNQPARFHIFHGATSLLRKQDMAIHQSDFENMQRILDNKYEPRLFRVEAGFALGVMHYSRNERIKAEEAYHDAVRIGEKVPNSKQTRMDNMKCVMGQANGSQAVEKTMKEFMEQILLDVKDNLANMNTATRSIGTSGIRFATSTATTGKPGRLTLSGLGMRCRLDVVVQN